MSLLRVVIFEISLGRDNVMIAQLSSMLNGLPTGGPNAIDSHSGKTRELPYGD